MKRLIGGVIALGLSSHSVFSADTNQFNDEQKKAIQAVVRDYLVNQPEVLIEASQSLQKKQQQQMQQNVQDAVSKYSKEIFNDPLAQVGPADAPVTLVEFFDYQCIHCKKMSPVLSEVMKKTPKLRVIFKEFPIFGEGSAVAARAALAAAKQNKYLAMHEALINAPGKLNEAVIMDMAKKLNLNIEKLKKDMSSPEVSSVLDNNRQLADKIHLMGTPAFIIASTPKGVYQANKPIYFIPGAASEASMLSFIKQAQG